MIIFLLQPVIMLCYSTLPVDGQRTFSSIKDDPGSRIDEYVLNILMELGQKLTTLQENVSSLDKCETVEPLSIEKTEGKPRVIDPSLARELNENYQTLKTTFQNLSEKFDRIDGKFQATNECLRTETQEKNSTISIQRLLSRVEKIEKGTQALNERLETSQMELHQSLISTLHNISYGRVERDTKFDILLKLVQEHTIQLDSMSNNLSARLDKIDERVTAAETIHAELVNKLEAMQQKLETDNQNLHFNLKTVNNTLLGILNETATCERLSTRLQSVNEIAGREMEGKLQKMQENVSYAFDKVNDKLNAVLYQANESQQNSKSQGKQSLCVIFRL